MCIVSKLYWAEASGKPIKNNKLPNINGHTIYKVTVDKWTRRVLQLITLFFTSRTTRQLMGTNMESCNNHIYRGLQWERPDRSMANIVKWVMWQTRLTFAFSHWVWAKNRRNINRETETGHIKMAMVQTNQSKSKYKQEGEMNHMQSNRNTWQLLCTS